MKPFKGFEFFKLASFVFGERVPNRDRILQLRADKRIVSSLFLSPFLFFVLMFHRMYPKVRFAFPVTLSMWEFQDMPLEISTHKYLELVTTSRIWQCKGYTVFITFLAVVTRTTWNLEGLNSVSHLLSHIQSVKICLLYGLVLRASNCEVNGRVIRKEAHL